MVAVLVLATACGTASSTTGGTTSETSNPTSSGTSKAMSSGVKGVTTAGPACPAQAAENPCLDRAVPASITITRVGSSEPTASVVTGRDGRFRLDLTPGRYVLTARLVGSSPLAMVQRRDVTVTADSYRAMEIRFDSGIR